MRSEHVFQLLLLGAMIGVIVFVVYMAVSESRREKCVRAVSVDGHDYVVNGNNRFTHLQSCWCFTNSAECVKH